MTPGAHLFDLLNVLQASLELAAAVPMAVAVVSHLFSQYNMVWRSFLWARVQGIEVLILLGALFLPGVVPASQQGFGVIELMLSSSAPYSESYQRSVFIYQGSGPQAFCRIPFPVTPRSPTAVSGMKLVSKV
jgi:hypothetical protein